ncbi:MAG: FG-GAP-like repeat-containing protein, partial [Acidobacteriota bacterium]
MSRSQVTAPAALLAAALLLLRGAGEDADRLWRHRHLGKAHYENPAAAAQAVDEFKQALSLAPQSFRERLNYGMALLRAGRAEEAIAELEAAQKQDPRLPHTWFNLGIAHKREGRYDRALEQLLGMTRQAPDEPVTHHNLGLLYNLTGREDLALKHFAIAAELDPNFAAPRYQLFNAHRLAGRDAEAARELALFQEIRKRKTADEQEDVEWCRYAEIYDPVEPAAPAATPAPALKFEARRLPWRADAATAGLLVLDADGDSKPDLLVFSRSGVRVTDHSLPGFAAAAGDFDNDGLADLCLLTARGAALYRNHKGKYEPHQAGLPPGQYHKALWLDYDHDYDLDLFLLGKDSVLVRNQGAAGFHRVEFPFLPGEAMDAVALRVVPGTRGVDLAVAYRERAAVLYRDQLGGKFSPAPLTAEGGQLQAADIDNDGWLDLAFAGSLLLNRGGRFEPAPARYGGIFADLENRGLADLVAGNAVYRNLGLGRFAPPRSPSGFPRAVAWAEADFDQDGRTDLAAVAQDGSVHLLTNRTSTANRWLRVGLAGVRNLALAPAAEVEVRAGAHYQKRVYQGLPLLFGLGAYAEADTVRITWPNGTIQNQTRQPSNQLAALREAPRLSGSCPMVFAWDGRRFEFIADVLGVAPLGAAAGEGRYFPVDHDEYIQIPGESLAPVAGRYEIRITEELREVSYLDQLRLIAVDHPREVEIVTNDKFKSPPFPEFRLFGVRERRYPVRATDHRGRDVLPRLLRRDRSYADGFRRNLAGVAERHWLELDFGAPVNRSVLVLHGWVDWADGSMFLNAAQS